VPHVTPPPAPIDICQNVSNVFPNVCKTGEILAEYIQSGQYDRVFYIGDSDNDFCPSALLSKYAHAILQSHRCDTHHNTRAHTTHVSFTEMTTCC
jgi:hypothetical protein